MAVGVVWELFEFSLGVLSTLTGVPPPLTQAGLDDTATDLLFDAVGAVVVAVWATASLPRESASTAVEVP